MKTKPASTDFYTQWMENQNAIMNSWVETAQKSTTAMMEGNLAKAVQHSSDAFATTLEQQRKLGATMLNQAETAAQGFATPFTTAYNGVNLFAPFWNQSSVNSADNANSGSPQMPFVDPASMMQAWGNWQKMMIQPWSQFLPQSGNIFEQWSRFAEAGTSSFATLGQIAKMYEQWQHLSQSWSVTAQKMYSSMAETMPSGVAKDTFRNMLSGANVYMKLFELWMPALELMKQGKTPKAEDLQNLMNPAQYKEVIDAVFEIMIPEQMQSLFSQVNSFMQSLNVSTNQATRIMVGQMEQNVKMIFGMMGHNPEAAVNIYNTLMSSYQQALSSMSALPVNQRQGEMIEIGQHILERLSEYSQTVTKFQHLLYTNGQKALEKMTETTFAVSRNKKTSGSFDEIFRTWVEANEEVFHDLFETKEYASIQSKLGQISSHLYKDFEQLFEVTLKDYPIVTRSHVDELAKTVFELKRKVRDLEKEGSVVAGEPAESVKSNGKVSQPKNNSRKK